VDNGKKRTDILVANSEWVGGGLQMKQDKRTFAVTWKFGNNFSYENIKKPSLKYSRRGMFLENILIKHNNRKEQNTYPDKLEKKVKIVEVDLDY
jgi:hypothetical protein